jgi:hypothetical protein
VPHANLGLSDSEDFAFYSTSLCRVILLSASVKNVHIVIVEVCFFFFLKDQADLNSLSDGLDKYCWLHFPWQRLKWVKDRNQDLKRVTY